MEQYVSLPNFMMICQTNAERWVIYLFFKIVSAIFDLLYTFGPPTKSIWWSLSLCKIWLESMQQIW